MTCSRRFDRLLQASCLGLVGMLALASCGGSSSKPDTAVLGDGGFKDGGSVLPPDAPPAVAVTVSPAAVTFDPTAIGDVSAPKTVTVTVKNGTATINPTVTGEFSIVSTTCGTALPTCTIAVQFGPGSTGAKSGILTIQAGLSVSLSGQGVPAGTFSVRSSLVPDTILVNASQPVSVTVTSSAALTDLKCEASGADLTADPTKTTCTGTVAAATPCVYAYIFKSATPGAKSDAVTCSSKGISQTVTINPTVVEPSRLIANPAKLDFAGVVINSTSPAQTVNIANAGGVTSGTLTATIAAGAGTTAAEFAIADNKCLVSLAALSTCPIQVVFKPATAGAKAATLTITDGVTPVTVPLAGTGIPDSKLAITGPATFAAALIGTPSAAATYTVTNSGGTATGILTMLIADTQFVISNDLCSGLPLAAGKTCTLSLVFTPSKAGVSSASLNATSAGALLASLVVSGTGSPIPLPANLVLSPPTLDFGTTGVGVPVGPRTFTVTNTGATPSTALVVEKNDSTSSVGGASQFTYTTTCQAALEPLQTCTVTVTFAPTISRSASATILVKDSAVTSNPGTVVGIALDRPTLSISNNCRALGFADTVVGQTSAPVVCTITNETDTAAGTPQASGAITPTITGDFAVSANNCTASLEPGLSCTISLVFRPTAKGEREGLFTVTSANRGAANTPVDGTGLGVIEIVEVLGMACVDHATCAPLPSEIETQPFDFEQVTVGTASATQLTLAVYVRAAVGNLSVTKAFGTPDEFAFVSAGGDDCDVYATASPPAVASRSGLTVPLCYKVVTFNPLNRATINGTVTVSGASGDTDSATMTGTGTGPLTVTPSPVTFASVAVGTSEVRYLTVKNNGAASLTINNLSFTLGGANANQFTVVEDNVTGQNLPGGGSTLTVGIRFIPTSVGAAAATFTVSGVRNDSSAIETANDSLLGNGAVGAAMTVTIGNNGVFADTYAGATSAPLTITVTNATGSLPTGAVTFSIDGSDFTTTPPTTTPATLQGTCADAARNPVNGGANCTMFVWFRPLATSNLTSRTGIITVSASPGVLVDLPLSGNALPQLTISPVGPATAPVDLGTAVIDTSTQPSQIFTITNHSESAIAAGGLVVTMEDSTNTPNLAALFSIDNTASNTCNAAVAGGATCVFKVTAIAVSGIAHMATPTNLGVFYSQIQGATGVQRTKADVKATVASKAALALTPATDQASKDIGVVALGATSYSAPVKYTLVNNGGVNSGPIALHLYGSATAGSTTALTKPSEWALSPATTCPTTEAGLAPGATCDIFVTFHPTVDAPQTTTSTAYVTITNTAGISTGEIRREIIGTATAGQLGPYLVDSTNDLAPGDLGALPATAVTRTVELHAGNVALTPGAGLATVTPSVVTDTIVVAAGDTNPCTAGTAISANGYCNIKLTITAAAVGGWHEFTINSITDASPDPSMKLFGRVQQPADLLASSDSLDFGMVPVSTVSPTQTITITNMGEATTAALTAVPSSATLVKTSGTCSGATLAYLATCTLNVWITPTATPGAISQTVAIGGITIAVTGTGAGAATLSTADVETTFTNTAVLSTTTAPLTFTFANAADAMTTGPLAVSVLNGTAVVPDFTITGGTCLTGTQSLGLEEDDDCTVIVKFKPRSLTTPAKTGTLTVTATPGGTATVVLRGTAVAALSVSNATGGVGAIASGAYNVSNSTSVSGAGTSVTVTFTNETNAPTTGILSASLTGTNAAEFRVTDDQCTGIRRNGGQSCTVELLFKPTTQGAKTATLTVSGTPGDSAALVLNGTAVIP